MASPDGLWAVLTVTAATAQTFRNAAQHGLTDRLGTIGATLVRFLFGLPFGLLAAAGLWLLRSELPRPTPAFLAWTALGAVAQIAATALMLSVMRLRSFVVTTAYTKTEPVQVALFGLAFLGEAVTPLLAAAILIATSGVMLMSWPEQAGGDAFSWRPALLGIASGALFALAAIGFRGGILGLKAPFLSAATFTLAVSLTLQTGLLVGWFLLRDRDVLLRALRAWRPSLAVGFLGAFASLMWFLAFSLETAARVRTLGLVEILVAGVVSRRLFAQTPRLRDLLGIVCVAAGVALLLTS